MYFLRLANQRPFSNHTTEETDQSKSAIFATLSNLQQNLSSSVFGSMPMYLGTYKEYLKRKCSLMKYVFRRSFVFIL